MEKYYFNQMDKAKQAVYRALLIGLQNVEQEIVVPQCDGAQLYDIFFLLRLDHPELFWAIGFQYKYYLDSPNLIVMPEYLFEKSKIAEHKKAMLARVKKLTAPMMQKSEWEKEKYVHDLICEIVRYDKLKKPYSHEIIGPLGHGVGVCEGIAKAVKVLLDELKVWCVIALCGNNPEKGIKYRHVWNIVRIDGVYYHLDVTFDNTLTAGGEEIRYDYFNLPDKQIFRDHEPLLFQVPACQESDHFYYREKKLSFTKVEEVYKRSLQTAKKGKVLTFHWRGGYLTREKVLELLEQMRKAGAERGKAPQVQINWTQAVMRLSYQDAAMQEHITMEDANIAEKED